MTYDGERFEMEDRLLAHLQVVISLKLRRSESFFLSWVAPLETGSGRHALWIDTGVPVHITYFGSRIPAINRQWVEELVSAANSSAGLVLSEEPMQQAGETPTPGTSTLRR